VLPQSISFDRAADYYDATRALPDDARVALAEVLAAELAGRGPCLEIGVGTGRIALPLHDRGIPLAGADIAPAMLRRLVRNAGGRQPFPLLRADATRLPLSGASFGAVLASHVLHLIPRWEAAVDEAMRVLRPGGALLADFGGGTQMPWSGPSIAVMERHGISHDRPGATAPGSVAAHLAGAVRPRPLPVVTMTFSRSFGEDLDRWERQVDAWTWPYTADQMRQACADLRAWAAAHRWPLDRHVEASRVIQWWAFERAHGKGR
jgi:SAM-dependent methyltransferase